MKRNNIKISNNIIKNSSTNLKEKLSVIENNILSEITNPFKKFLVGLQGSAHVHAQNVDDSHKYWETMRNRAVNALHMGNDIEKKKHGLHTFTGTRPVAPTSTRPADVRRYQNEMRAYEDSAVLHSINHKGSPLHTATRELEGALKNYDIRTPRTPSPILAVASLLRGYSGVFDPGAGSMHTLGSWLNIAGKKYEPDQMGIAEPSRLKSLKSMTG
jgi:hypothetical protein